MELRKLTKKVNGYSLIILLELLVLYALFTCKIHNIYENADIYWLLKTGQWIVQHQVLPWQNIFTEPGSTFDMPWVTYQWGFMVIESLIYRYWGDWGNSFLILGIFTTLMCVYAQILKNFGVTSHKAFAYALLQVVAIALTYASVRPYLLTMLFFTLLLWVTYHPLMNQEKTSQKKKLIYLGIIFCLWANCHLGFLIGLLLVVFQNIETFLKTGSKRAFFPVLVSVIASCLNPWGWGLFLYLVHLGASPAMNNGIDELRSVNFHTDFGIMIYLVLFIYCFSTVLIKRLLPKSLYFFSIVTMCLGLYSFRHLFFWMLVMGILIGKTFDTEKESDKSIVSTFSPVLPPLWKSLLCSLTVLIMVMFLLPKQMAPYQLRPRLLTPALTQYFTKRPVNSRTLCDPSLSSETIYFLSQGCFMDTRFDMYGDQLFSDLSAMYTFNQNWKELFQKHNINKVVFLTEAHALPIYILANREHWLIEYKDSKYTVLVRQ